MALDIFITGLGIVSGIGVGIEETATSLRHKKSGIGKIKYLNTIHDLPCAEVNLSETQMKQMLGIKECENVNRTALMAMLATREAIAQAKLPLDGT